MKITLRAIVGMMMLAAMSCLYGQSNSGDMQSDYMPDVQVLEAEGPFQLKVIIGEPADIQLSEQHLSVDGIPSSEFLNSRIDGKTLYLSSTQKDLTVTVSMPSLQKLCLKNMGISSVTAKKPVTLNMDIDQVQAFHINGAFLIPKLTIKGYSLVSSDGVINIGIVDNGSMAMVNLKGLSAQTMHVYQTGSGELFLRGHADVLMIDQNSHGNIDTKHTSHTTSVHANSESNIRLRGKTQNLAVNLKGDAVLNATQLEAQDVTVKTFDASKALVNPINRLMASSYQSSAIYYEHDPVYLYTASKQGSHILHLPAMQFPMAQTTEAASLYKGVY